MNLDWYWRRSMAIFVLSILIAIPISTYIIKVFAPPLSFTRIRMEWHIKRMEMAGTKMSMFCSCNCTWYFSYKWNEGGSYATDLWIYGLTAICGLQRFASYYHLPLSFFNVSFSWCLLTPGPRKNPLSLKAMSSLCLKPKDLQPKVNQWHPAPPVKPAKNVKKTQAANKPKANVQADKQKHKSLFTETFSKSYY